MSKGHEVRSIIFVNRWDTIMLMFIDSHGGALVNLIHSYTDNGDPFVRKFTDELLEEVSVEISSIPQC